MQIYVVTHAEVAVDPAVPVPEWGLSAAGRARLTHLVAQPWVPTLTGVVSSAERKALQTAEVLADAAGLPVGVDEELGENDRSSTGYLRPEEFEAVADAFFARPEESVRGWERAVDAQRRFVAAVQRAVAGATGDVAVVAHGAVGALLLCSLLGVPVDRRYDQPGQGSFFRFDAVTGRVLHGWQRLDGAVRDAALGL
ncbi:Broad specificity phosphatase PhoE [Blastococcus aggregatus]|uniref:Broad specificity phosphatase PhoE n=1 Tax=Blastococcus aggregatus TaxID=38502 RepID=A0A285V977_9ACTN|nr:histidine phosphatase family protein [Blastococcus aggregatus]SOC50629.1 Broad specificity phosphatase PhoE [Blastococcus aggregatus]